MYYPRSVGSQAAWAKGGGDAHPMIHPDFQGRDFAEIKTGDPFYLDLDGSTIPFLKGDHDIAEDISVFPFFINEVSLCAMSITSQ